MRAIALLFLALAALGCSQSGSAGPGPLGAQGDWVQFYSREFGERRLVYFYDRSSVRRTGDVLSARWKVLGSPEPTVTLHRFEIACGAARFTERGTVIIDAQGRARELPASELMVDRPIEAGTSSDVFRRRFCG